MIAIVGSILLFAMKRTVYGGAIIILTSFLLFFRCIYNELNPKYTVENISTKNYSSLFNFASKKINRYVYTIYNKIQ